MRIPLVLGYALFRHFHRPSSGVMVPTQAVLELLQGRGFRNLRRWTHGVDTRLFAHADAPLPLAQFDGLPRPLSLFVGRVSYEKNIDAFLKADLPGTKIVCGVGPLEGRLRAEYPGVVWLGVLARPALAQVYAAADRFVFPSRSETFGLVMLEAMACGTPVAAYPVDGPTEVLGRPAAGGVLHDDLVTAAEAALAVPRHEARQRALAFSWSAATELFVRHLVTARREPASRPAAPTVVTPLSSNRHTM